MNSRTKIFSVLVLGLLFLPILLSPERGGQVLGTSDSPETGSVGLFGAQTETSTPPVESGSVARTNAIGEIASGVSSTRTTQESTQDVEFTGKVLLNNNASVSVSSDKFPIGSDIQVVVGGQVYNLVVQGRTVLSTDTILVLDEETFTNLGGDTSTGQMEVTVRLNS